MKKVFEVNPVLCVKCGGVMVLTALIQDDQELDRILAHQGWPADFPQDQPRARSPGASGALGNYSAIGGYGTGMMGGTLTMVPGILGSVKGASLNLDEVHAYPTPYMLSRGHTRITFTELPALATIQVFSLSGRLVKTLMKNDSTDSLDWSPVANNQGSVRPAAAISSPSRTPASPNARTRSRSSARIAIGAENADHTLVGNRTNSLILRTTNLVGPEFGSILRQHSNRCVIFAIWNELGAMRTLSSGRQEAGRVAARAEPGLELLIELKHPVVPAHRDETGSRFVIPAVTVMALTGPRTSAILILSRSDNKTATAALNKVECWNDKPANRSRGRDAKRRASKSPEVAWLPKPNMLDNGVRSLFRSTSTCHRWDLGIRWPAGPGLFLALALLAPAGRAKTAADPARARVPCRAGPSVEYFPNNEDAH